MVDTNRKLIGNISARIHDSNEIPTVIPMFSGSDNTERLERILDNVGGIKGAVRRSIPSISLGPHMKWLGNFAIFELPFRYQGVEIFPSNFYRG